MHLFFSVCSYMYVFVHVFVHLKHFLITVMNILLQPSFSFI